MRPVDRGAVPLDTVGNPKVYVEYADARGDLFARLGRYCSFCERSIKAGLAVEHVHHKHGHPHLECEWTNFLLACVNCNSRKGTQVVRRKQVLLPDQDNTFMALTYSIGGRVLPHPSLSPPLKAKAMRLIRMVGLNSLPIDDVQARDMRWNDRREAWDKAVRYRTKYSAGLIDTASIVDLCLADGHWSIWMTVFDSIAEIRIALVAAVPGMPAGCFDPSGNPTPRPGGQI
jgi:uncharacterized protein (TIGR02646 family)